jgi:tripartite-type tricarboxylate transporter receptor subunit TctC
MYPHIYRPLSYDVFVDLTPVQTLEAFGEWCKASPSLSSCGNAGAGSFPHFMALLVARDTGLALNHVPYRGGSAAMLALTGGQVSAALATEGSALALEQSGKVHVLATTATGRSSFFPTAPSFSELGYRNLAQREWFGAFMPRQAQAAAVASVAEEIAAMLGEGEHELVVPQNSARRVPGSLRAGLAHRSPPPQAHASIARRADLHPVMARSSA